MPYQHIIIIIIKFMKREVQKKRFLPSFVSPKDSG